MLKKRSLFKKLKKIGIRSSDTILIHSSFKRLGKQKFEPKSFLVLLEEYMKDVAETGSTTTKTKTLHGGVEEDAYFHDVRVSVTLFGCCKLSSQIDCHANQSSIPEWGITALFHYGCLLCIFECTRTSMLQHYEGAVRLLRAQIILESPNAQGREASKLQIPRLRNVVESPHAQGHEASKFQIP